MHLHEKIHAIRTGEWSQWIERHSETLRRLAAAHDFQAQNARILLVPAALGGATTRAPA